jgi:hypothetical protein
MDKSVHIAGGVTSHTNVGNAGPAYSAGSPIGYIERRLQQHQAIPPGQEAREDDVGSEEDIDCEVRRRHAVPGSRKA